MPLSWCFWSWIYANFVFSGFWKDTHISPSSKRQGHIATLVYWYTQSRKHLSHALFHTSKLCYISRSKIKWMTNHFLTLMFFQTCICFFHKTQKRRILKTMLVSLLHVLVTETFKLQKCCKGIIKVGQRSSESSKSHWASEPKNLLLKL